MYYTVFRVRRDKEVGHQSVDFFFGFFIILVRQPEVRHQSVTLKSPYRDFRENPLWCVFFSILARLEKKPIPWGFWKDHALDLLFAA